MMEPEATYLVVDAEGFKIVMNSGGAQMVIAGPCRTVDEALIQAFRVRGYNPIALRVVPC